MSVDNKQIPITSPCPITLDREGLTPEDRAMHCAHCVKDVHLLSNMTESEARMFMKTQAGNDICVSYAIKKDGGIRFKASELRPEHAVSTPDFVPLGALTRVARRATRPATASAAPRSALIVLGTALLLAACAPHSNTSAIKVDEAALAPYSNEIVIPVERPSEVQDEMVEGEIEAMELVEDIQVDGGLEAMPIPDEPRVAGGISAFPIDETPSTITEVPEVHTPPTQLEPPVERQVRGRVAPSAVGDPLG